MAITAYKLSYDEWVELGCPEFPEDVVWDDMTAEDGYFYITEYTDADGDSLPDFLEGLPGADVILRPSNCVVIG